MVYIKGRGGQGLGNGEGGGRVQGLHAVPGGQGRGVRQGLGFACGARCTREGAGGRVWGLHAVAGAQGRGGCELSGPGVAVLPLKHAHVLPYPPLPPPHLRRELPGP